MSLSSVLRMQPGGLFIAPLFAVGSLFCAPRFPPASLFKQQLHPTVNLLFCLLYAELLPAARRQVGAGSAAVSQLAETAGIAVIALLYSLAGIADGEAQEVAPVAHIADLSDYLVKVTDTCLLYTSDAADE